MNSITLDYLLRVKVRQIFPKLFIGNNRVVVFPESSIVRSDVYFFVQDSTILFQWSVAALFHSTFAETPTVKYMLIIGDVMATVHLSTQT